MVPLTRLFDDTPASDGGAIDDDWLNGVRIQPGGVVLRVTNWAEIANKPGQCGPGSALMKGMGRKSALAVAATAVVILVAIWVSGAGRVWFVEGTTSSGESSSSVPQEPDPTGQADPADMSADISADDKPGDGSTSWPASS